MRVTPFRQGVIFGFTVWLGLFFGHVAYGQNVVSLTVTPSTFAASAIPALAWSTTPPIPASCIASGGWSGAKAASGTQILPAITATTAFTLTCTWSAVAAIMELSWVNPTQNVNNTPYINPKNITIKYRLGVGSLLTATPCVPPVSCVVVTPPSSTMRTITGLGAGTYSAAAFAVNALDAMSDPSNVVNKTFTGGGSAAASATSTLVPVAVSKPKPPVLN